MLDGSQLVYFQKFPGPGKAWLKRKRAGVIDVGNSTVEIARDVSGICARLGATGADAGWRGVSHEHNCGVM